MFFALESTTMDGLIRQLNNMSEKFDITSFEYSVHSRNRWDRMLMETYPEEVFSAIVQYKEKAPRERGDQFGPG